VQFSANLKIAPDPFARNSLMRIRIVAVVCIAIFALTVATAVLPPALLDALAPIDPLFSALPPVVWPTDENVLLPEAPVADSGSPRAPPLA
jgi:hypothetical protein